MSTDLPQKLTVVQLVSTFPSSVETQHEPDESSTQYHTPTSPSQAANPATIILLVLMHSTVSHKNSQEF